MKKKGSSEELSDYDNEDLYNQPFEEIDDVQETKKVSPFEKEYNAVIQIMSNICRNLVWNNNPSNANRNMKIDENERMQVCPRLWNLATELGF